MQFAAQGADIGLVDKINHFLQAVLTSLRGGVVVVDSDRHVLVWNPHAADLWGVREDEVLRSDLLTVDIGLLVDALATPLARVLSGRSESEELTLRRGDPSWTRRPVPGNDHVAQPDACSGAILVMEVVLADETYA